MAAAPSVAALSLDDDESSADYNGLPIQHFDLERDVEEDGAPPDKVTMVEKVKAGVLSTAPKIGANMALGAVTGAPGIVFGVGSAIASAAATKLQDHLAKGEDLSITVMAVRVVDLKAGVTGPMGKRKMSPYVKAQLLVNGEKFKGKGGFNIASSAKTKCFQSGGQDVSFPDGKHVCKLGLPVKPEEKDSMKTACLLLEVHDEPEVGMLTMAPGLNFKCGAAVASLGQLITALEENESVTAPINLQLDTQGVLRVTVTLSRKST